MYSNIFPKIFSFIVSVIVALILISCSGGGGSGSDSDADMLDMTFTSRAGFNINCNYNTATLCGTSNSGEITLSGSSGRLTGTYSHSNSRGVYSCYYWYVHWADGVVMDYNCTVSVMNETFMLRVEHNNTTRIYLGSSNEADIDPFEGTEWKGSGIYDALTFTFHDGHIGGNFVTSVLNEYHAGNNATWVTDCWYDESATYIVIKIPDGYKAVFLACKKDNQHIECNEWDTITISGSNANEAVLGHETHSVSKVDSYKHDSAVPVYSLVKIN